MVHKHAFEALDRSLNNVFYGDISRQSYKYFGGKVIVFGGDFRQKLPVVANGSGNDIVNALLSSSYIWDNCKVLKLTKNMRLNLGSLQYDTGDTKKFAKWL